MSTLPHHNLQRNAFLYLDLGFYSACNLRCTYCRDDYVRDRGDYPLSRLQEQVEAFLLKRDAAVVKLSGYGEVTMWKWFEPCLEYLTSLFPTVQVITNGAFSESVRRSLTRFRNVSVNFTIDGHSIEANGLRVGSNRELHARILGNLDALVGDGCAVEVNCVLHSRNAAALADFCSYLSRRGNDQIMLFPFPVKQFALASRPAENLRQGIGSLADDLPRIWDDYQDILPPRPYMERLRSYLLGGERSGDCHVHWANLGSGSRDERLHCPNYGEDLSYGPMADALDAGRADILAREISNLKAGRVGPQCSTCYNHFHIINLFLEREIGIDELCRTPSLRQPGCRRIAQSVLEQFETAVSSLKSGMAQHAFEASIPC